MSATAQPPPHSSAVITRTAGDGDPSNGEQRSPTVVLVHGGWMSSDSWGPLVPALMARGHRVVALDTPGHGWRARYPEGYFAPGQPDLHIRPSPLAGVSLEEAADAVVGALRTARQTSGGEVVLVSHSISGAFASLAAEKAPELVDHLVYVAAIVPSRLTSVAAVGALPEYGSPTMDGLVVADPAAVGALRINPRSTDTGYRDLLRRKFYGDLAPEAADAFLDHLTPDQPVRFLADEVHVTQARWGSIPRTYVRTAEDASIAPAVQTIMVEDADALTPGNQFHRVDVDSGHCPFASRPEELADVISGVDVSPRRR